MNDSIIELAKLFKARDNEKHYSCLFGTVVSLEPLNIMINNLITINEIKTTFNLYEKDEDGNFVNVGKQVVLLPYSSMQKFIAIGVIR